MIKRKPFLHLPLFRTVKTSLLGSPKEQ